MSESKSTISRIDYSFVEYNGLYSRLKTKARTVDPRVYWITEQDEVRFHSNVDDLKTIGELVQKSTDSWYNNNDDEYDDVSKHQSTIHEVPPILPNPIQPNSTLFFMDWMYLYTGIDLNENPTLLYWQSRLTYFSPWYQLLYPLLLVLIGYIVCWITSAASQCISLWSYICMILYSFWHSITQQGFRKGCFALIKPAMYIYALYEACKSRTLHDKAVSETTNQMKSCIQYWRMQYSTIKAFCAHSAHYLEKSNKSLQDGFVQQTIIDKFASIQQFFSTFFKEYDYLVNPSTSPSELYSNVGKTLMLRWQLSLTPERGTCQQAISILQGIASKVAVFRLWNILLTTMPKLHVVNWIIDGSKEETMMQSYYPFLLLSENEKEEEIVVGNDCLFGRSNAIVTGPNATGKTTYLKSVMLNLLFAHHVGLGFFKECTIAEPFQNFFCYINVPDTSDRESLFQAEAARALSILTHAEESAQQGKRTFAIFDELFTGTNPEDASKLTKSLIRYLNENLKLRFLTTTHFTSAIESMKEEDENVNSEQVEKEPSPSSSSSCKLRYLQTEYNSQTGERTFHLQEGVSKESNVLKVLTELKFPEKILCCL